LARAQKQFVPAGWGKVGGARGEPGGGGGQKTFAAVD